MNKSSNFSFLAGQERLLYEIASSAENAFAKDPNATLVRLRQLAEHLVRNLAAQVGIQPAPELKLVDLIISITPKLALDGKIVKLLHHLRVQGNSAAHEYRQDHRDAADAMRSARELCIWYYRTFCDARPDFRPGPFVNPRNWHSEEASLEREVERLQSLLAGEIEHSSAKNDLIRQLESERERLAALADEHRRDAEASFSLAEEQCRHAEELRADYESRLRRLAEERAARPFDTQEYAERSHDATQKTAADWVPEVTLTQFLADEELTADQSRLAACLENFLRDPEAGVFLMTGAAGTGKTFMTKGLTNFLSTCARRSVLIAPTGKAARVLAGKAGSPAATIHSAIYSTKDVKEYKVEDVNGTETFKFYYDLRVNDGADNTVYIVDEASMVSDVYSEGEFFRFGSGRLLSDLMQYVNLDHNDHSKKIIFIG
ncbi:MAG: AAA family ATPase, partial [Nitrospira sp.]|nr:AAA family ATPase [Nitrospira sp.]